MIFLEGRLLADRTAGLTTDLIAVLAADLTVDPTPGQLADLAAGLTLNLTALMTAP